MRDFIRKVSYLQSQLNKEDMVISVNLSNSFGPVIHLNTKGFWELEKQTDLKTETTEHTMIGYLEDQNMTVISIRK